ncbi:MAG: UvrD-helicase domain-containing protein [Ignavibacteriae bacterium]|nr:UvrD-helicase domain-containing protein [Ignavibacteriota bacterium]
MLTQSQQLALDTSRHLSVTANAGSGKTMVLVERFITILLSERTQVKEVVALTFTEKAASELKRKISESVAKKLAEVTDATQRARLRQVREQLSGAVIDTIHSFCAKLLREYPVEAGVDASFTVLEVVDQMSKLEAATKETFAAILKAEEGNMQRARTFNLLRALGKFRVLSIVRTLVLKREQVSRWLEQDGLYTKSDEEILQLWKSHLSEFVEGEFADPQLMSDLEVVVNAASGKAQLAINAEFKALKRGGSLETQLVRFGSLLEKMLTTQGTLRKKVFGENGEIAEQAARLQTKYKALTPLLEFVKNPNDEAHRVLLSQARVLLELYQNVIERYEEKKIEGAHLDFDDLQIHLKNLLRNQRIAERLAQRFKYVMVDEYQDTNRLQYEILLPLLNQLTRGNLFIVGDPKQSIYGFRDADVTVFNRTKKDIEDRAGKESAVVLSDSFRPLRDLVAFVNLVFEPLMQGNSADYEVVYEPLVRGRQNNQSGRVELILCDESADESALSEGELIARRILQLRESKYQVFGKDETPHDLRFSDVAILLRTRNGLSDLEEAFIHHNIPYLVTGGVGYFQTQGIYDIANYFRFLLNPDDDVALTGVLRSPFFTVSDAELFEAAYERRSKNLWAHVRSRGSAVKNSAALTRAVDVLLEDVEVADRLSVPDLVNRIIERTSYAGFVAGMARSDQLFANLEKLKRLARKYEEQGFTNLYDFVARLKRLIDEEPDEGQAAVDVFADAVNVMTIHAAKGLEFPVVIIPSLERSFIQDSEPFLDNELGFAFGERDDASGAAPITEYLRRRTQRKNIAEEKRVFYVACTRARDMLILSGRQREDRNSTNYMNWLLNGLRCDRLDAECQIERETRTQFLQLHDDRYATNAESHTLIVHVLHPADLQASIHHVRITSVDDGARTLMLDPIPVNEQGEIFSASKIRTYVECPAKYYLRYVVGIPTTAAESLPRGDIEDADVSIPAELRGRAFHHLMQHIDSRSLDARTLRGELKKFIAQDSLSVISEPMIELDAIVQSVLDLVGTDFWRDVQRGSDARTEFTIMTACGDDFLTGTLDRLYRDELGVWTIIDYKTDAVDAVRVKERVTLYEPQLKFYALLAHKLFGAERVNAHLYFAALQSPVRFTYVARELQQYEIELINVMQRIHSGDFPAPARLCDGCPFLPAGCRAVLR